MAQTIRKVQDTGTNGTSGSELIEFDGTRLMLIDINPGSSNSSPNNFVIFQNKLTFMAISGAHGMELWTYDSTNATEVSKYPKKLYQ